MILNMIYYNIILIAIKEHKIISLHNGFLKYCDP